MLLTLEVFSLVVLEIVFYFQSPEIDKADLRWLGKIRVGSFINTL